jgi:hypothetical protein
LAESISDCFGWGVASAVAAVADCGLIALPGPIIAAMAMQVLANFIWISATNVAVRNVNVPAEFVADNPTRAVD